MIVDFVRGKRAHIGAPSGQAGALLRVYNDDTMPDDLRNAWFTRIFRDPLATGDRQNVRIGTEAHGTKHGTKGLMVHTHGYNVRPGGDADGGSGNLTAITARVHVEEADDDSRVATWAYHGLVVDKSMREGTDEACPSPSVAEFSIQAYGPDGDHRHRDGLGRRVVQNIEAKGYWTDDPPADKQTGHEIGVGTLYSVDADKSCDKAGVGARLWGFFRRCIAIDGVGGPAMQVQAGLDPYTHKIGLDIGMMRCREDDGIAAIRIHKGSGFDLPPERAKIVAESEPVRYGLLMLDDYGEAAISLPSGQAIEWRREDGSTVRLTHNPQTDQLEVDGVALVAAP